MSFGTSILRHPRIHAGMHKVLVPSHSSAHRFACELIYICVSYNLADDLTFGRFCPLSSASPAMSRNKHRIMAG
jgi:hypothetical protein